MFQMPEGRTMYSWAEDLFPIYRCLTGNGIRESLNYIKKILPGLTLHEVPSGTDCFDWTVPDEWNVREAWIMDESGNKIIDIKSNNLHLMGYSHSIDVVLSLDELDAHLHSLPNQPNAIPYVTSYYSRRWGFCLTHNQRQALTPQNYRVFIDADLGPGHMTYAELFLPGESEETILLSTYVCHPSMANNELSGPVLQTALGRMLSARDRKKSYLLLFIPETIGAIYYLSRNLERLQKTVVAGFVLSCCGDDRGFSYLPSRKGNSLSDRVLLNVLKNHHPGFARYTFLDRASDERQYQSPGVDIPVIPFSRSLYRHYPEYHTSLDDLSVISPAGLQRSFDALSLCFDILEGNHIYMNTCLCEPRLGKRGLYPELSIKGGYSESVDMIIDFLIYCDGENDLLQIADIIGAPAEECLRVARKLMENGLLKIKR